MRSLVRFLAPVRSRLSHRRPDVRLDPRRALGPALAITWFGVSLTGTASAAPPPDVDGWLAAHPEVAAAMLWEFEPAVAATPAPTATPTATPAKPAPTLLPPHGPRPTAVPGGISWPRPLATARPGFPHFPIPTLAPPATATPGATSTPTATPVPTATVLAGVEAAWPAWPEARKQKLRASFAAYWTWLEASMPLYESWAGSGFAEKPAGFDATFDGAIDPDPAPVLDPPANVQLGLPGGSTQTVVASAPAFDLYVKHAALALALEARQAVPWSLLDLDAESRLELLDGRRMFDWVNAGPSPWGTIQTAGHRLAALVIPAPPLLSFSFLARHALLGGSRVETIARTLDWSRRLRHTFSGAIASGASGSWVFWQYVGRAPLTRVMNGTVMSEPIGSTWVQTVAHWTGGCGGTTGFLRELLRVASIPVTPRVPSHFLPHFRSEGLSLSHGDDPYALSPEIPIAELLIDEAQYDAWFVNDPDPLHNVGRRAAELHIEYLSLRLLDAHCRDLWLVELGLQSPDHAASSVYGGFFASLYSVAELEAIGLWADLDEKLSTFPGGCAGLPPPS